jgi:hypothetical protein
MHCHYRLPPKVQRMRRLVSGAVTPCAGKCCVKLDVAVADEGQPAARASHSGTPKRRQRYSSTRVRDARRSNRWPNQITPAMAASTHCDNSQAAPAPSMPSAETSAMLSGRLIAA